MERKLRKNEFGVSINCGRTFVGIFRKFEAAKKEYNEMCWRGLKIGACIIDSQGNDVTA